MLSKLQKKISLGGDNKSIVYSVNVGAVLGQISTEGGGAQLEEQMSAIYVPSMRVPRFCILERKLGTVLEKAVTSELISAGLEEKRLAIARGEYHQGIPATTVVVDAGWSKRSHKHSNNANSGVGVIFGFFTKRLLFIGIHNKYSCTCSIATKKYNTRSKKSDYCSQSYR